MMETEIQKLNNIDEAAKAFGKLRREVTTMRLAIEQLVDEPNRIEIPDYNETLVDMSAHIADMSKYQKAMGASPALELTPETMARQLVQARKETQVAERASLDQSIAALDKATKAINSYIESARNADIQNKWVLGAGALALVAGIILCTTIQILL